jgi:hypothetical protein
MTLADCIKKHGLNVSFKGNLCAVLPYQNHPADLWHCSDYVVSSVSGGCVWLRRIV